MRALNKIIFALSLLLLTADAASAARCWCTATSQESTQLTNKAQLIKQLEEQVRMVDNQLAMLQSLSSSMTSGLNGANTIIMQQFNSLLSAWKKATSLTHVMDNFEDLHKKRHPEHVEGTMVHVENERRRRDAEWAAMIDAYLRGLNLSSQQLENAQAAREQLFSVLQSTTGQVQAIQALGAMVNHVSMILERNGEIMAGYTTMFAENESDKRALVDNERKNVETALDGLIENTKPTGKGHKPDIKSVL